MNRKIKYRFFSVSLLLLLLILASLSLYSCDGAPNEVTDTTVTESPLVTDSPLDYTFDTEEMNRFLALVEYDKLLQVQEIFEALYVGEYKPYSEIGIDVIKSIAATIELEKITTVDEATTAFIDAYLHVMGDKYAYYYDAEAYKDYQQDVEGEYAGIGVSVTMTEDRYIEVLNVFSESPADKVGILPGDILVEVNGEDIVELGYYKTIDMVRGEIGTSVNLTVDRDGERLSFDVVRDKVTEVTVEYEMKDDGLGYIRITSFDSKTYSQFVEAYTQLEEQGAKGLIFDVRNNPGGTLDSVVAILEYILPNGPIVHMEYKNPANNYTISSVKDCSPLFNFYNRYYKNHEIKLPMVVLTNENTASAGELFTSSLNDYDAATVVGVRTYGKGVGQRGFSLTDENGEPDGSVVTITYFYYAPPYSENYDGVGIEPDILAELPLDAQNKNIYKLTEEQDTQLKAGVEELLRMMRVMNAVGN